MIILDKKKGDAMNMLSPSSPTSSVKNAQTASTIQTGADGSFTIEMADALLRSTMQYGKWQEIRQKNSVVADKIANLVVQRHSYVSGEAQADDQGRLIFDRITDDLRKEGICLYKSNELQDSIFKSKSGSIARKNVNSYSDGKNGQTDATEKVLELRSRFANKDCYEFLAGIIEDKGIKYFGKNGVAGALLEKAKTEGKSSYAYFTGEGITDLLCKESLTISIPKATKSSLNEIWNQLEPQLKEGAILSYSSKNFGHTGVVNKVNDEWVFVNSSGKTGNKKSYRVLEENLKTEINGWLQRAQRNGTSLNITLGSVDKELASKYSKSLQFSRYTDGANVNLMA
jgi:hypothetical protein